MANNKNGVLSAEKLIKSNEFTLKKLYQMGLADAIKRNLFVNKDMLDIRKQMGDPDSYFFSDTIYAYKITEPGPNKESWQLIFVPDKKLKKVKEIKIHKKCCYKNPF